jgi:hypothetical protein
MDITAENSKVTQDLEAMKTAMPAFDLAFEILVLSMGVLNVRIAPDSDGIAEVLPCPRSAKKRPSN